MNRMHNGNVANIGGFLDHPVYQDGGEPAGRSLMVVAGKCQSDQICVFDLSYWAKIWQQ